MSITTEISESLLLSISLLSFNAYNSFFRSKLSFISFFNSLREILNLFVVDSIEFFKQNFTISNFFLRVYFLSSFFY
jgi:hypothetical protein